MKITTLCTEGPQAQMGISKQRAQQQYSSLGLRDRYSTPYMNEKIHRPYARRISERNWAHPSRRFSNNTVLWACLQGPEPKKPMKSIATPCTEGPRAQLGAPKQRAQQQRNPLGLLVRYSTPEINDKNCDLVHREFTIATGRTIAAGPDATQSSGPAYKVQRPINLRQKL